MTIISWHLVRAVDNRKSVLNIKGYAWVSSRPEEMRLRISGEPGPNFSLKFGPGSARDRFTATLRPG